MPRRLLLLLCGMLVGAACSPPSPPGVQTRWLSDSTLRPSAPPPLEYGIYVPPEAPADRPLTVLVALHGMGSNGPEFCHKLVEEAGRHDWVLLAPTITYRDWRDPDQVRQDGFDVLPSLKQLIEELPAKTGLKLRRKVLLYGFSRGAQAAHRFALFYPSLTRAVVAMSPATYTLPSTYVNQGVVDAPLKFPFGVGDLDDFTGRPFDADGIRQVDFWIGVGGQDPLPTDSTRPWDPYIGTSRVERAQSFAKALTSIGVHAELNVYPNAGHEVTGVEQTQALDFLAHLTG